MMIKVCFGFPQPLHARLVPQIMLLPVPFTSFHIYYSPIFIPFEVAEAEILTASLGKPYYIIACRSIVGQRSRNDACYWGSGFLMNGVTKFVSGLQLSKHVPAATDMNAEIEER
jgi:ABC-type multidrug transport system permease subunit